MNFPSKTHKVVSASSTLTNSKLDQYDVIVANTAGIIITLPAAGRGNADMCNKFVNSSSGPVIVACPSGSTFVNGASSVVLDPYGTADLRCVNLSAGSFKFSLTGDVKTQVMSTWTPTLTWTTHDPTVTTGIYEYVLTDGTLFFNIDIRLSDGKDSTGLTITPPIALPSIATLVPCSGVAIVDGTATDCAPYVDQADGTITNRVIGFKAMPTLTDTKACTINVSGFAVIDGWSSYSPTIAYTTGTPASQTTVALTRMFGDKVCGIVIGNTSADSNGATQVTVTLPTIVNDNNVYYRIPSLELAGTGGATYYRPIAYIDGLDNTVTNRVLTTRGFTAATDNQAIGFYAAGFYEVNGWTAFTPTFTFTGTAPGTQTKFGRFTTYNGLCFCTLGMSSADGNGATAVVATLPAPPYYKATAKWMMPSYELVNTTYSNALFRAASDDADVADRVKATATKFSTMTDAAACALVVSGAFPVG